MPHGQPGTRFNEAKLMGKSSKSKRKLKKLKPKQPAAGGPAPGAQPPLQQPHPQQAGPLTEKIFGYIRLAPVTSTILAINGLVFLVGVVFSLEREILLWGASERSAIWAGEYWRLFTPVVLHAGVFHWLVNTYALFLIGTVVERDLGRLRYTLLYVVAGMAGVAVSVLGNDVLSVGASGAILGLFGAALTIKLFQPYSLFARVEWRFFLINGALLIGITVMGFAGLPIDNLAHFGGLVMGLLLGSVLSLSRHPKQTPGRVKVLWGLAAVLLLIAAGLSAAATQRWPGMGSRMAVETHADNAEAAAAHGDYDAVLEQLERAEQFGELAPVSLFQRAYALIRLERSDEAEAALEPLLTHPQGEHYGRFARGILREQQGKREEAAEDLRTAFELAPTDWPQRDAIQRYLDETRRAPGETEPDE